MPPESSSDSRLLAGQPAINEEKKSMCLDHVDRTDKSGPSVGGLRSRILQIDRLLIDTSSTHARILRALWQIFPVQVCVETALQFIILTD